MKHTPGPWRVVHYAWEHHSGDFCGRIENLDGEEIYHGAGCFNAIDSLANARLIAAAPRMLEALKEIADRCLHAGGIGDLAPLVVWVGMEAEAVLKEVSDD